MTVPTESEYEYGGPETGLDPVQELRVMVCGLGLIVLLMSLALSLFIEKQNSNIRKQVEHNRSLITSQFEQNQLFQQNKAGMQNLLAELAQQVSAHPEVKDILARYGVKVENRPPVPRL